MVKVWLSSGAVAIACWLVAAPQARCQENAWRTDYPAARREAQEKNRPLVLDIGTENCLWCKKLEAGTFRDPAVVQLLRERFVAVKLDAGQHEQLVQTLGIQSYPTLVFAAPDGKLLGKHVGFVDAAQFTKQLQRALAESKAGPTAPASVGEEERLDRLRQTCASLTDTLGELYLELAESLLRQNRPQQAMQYLQQVVQTCADTKHARLAQEKLVQLHTQAAAPPTKPVVRAQSP